MQAGWLRGDGVCCCHSCQHMYVLTMNSDNSSRPFGTHCHFFSFKSQGLLYHLLACMPSIVRLSCSPHERHCFTSTSTSGIITSGLSLYLQLRGVCGCINIDTACELACGMDVHAALVWRHAGTHYLWVP